MVLPLASPPYPFRVGERYTRSDVFQMLGIIPEPKGGPWLTGYTDHGDDVFIFCNIGVAGRTGHDYQNHFVGDRLVWRGKGPSRLAHSSIQRMLDPNRRVYVFFREGDREPFTFAGLATAVEASDDQPVRIVWAFRDVSSNVAALSQAGDAEAPRSRKRLPASELRKVTAEHILNALNKLREPNFTNVYGPSTDFDAVTNLGERFPPKAVFGIAATEALGFLVLPVHFSSGEGHVAFDILKDAGLLILRKDEAAPKLDIPLDDEDRAWTEGKRKLVQHLQRERSTGASKAKKAEFKRLNGRLYCEHCLMDPTQRYDGPEGEACIEVHHRSVHISDMAEDHKTRLEDLECLCANCHRVEHRRLKAGLREREEALG